MDEQIQTNSTMADVDVISVRPATVADVPAMLDLITYYAERHRMLFRSAEELYEKVRDFFVAVDAAGTVVGCCGLEVLWKDLAEVKSLAVSHQYRGKGIGRLLVNATIDNARTIGLERVFALTYEEGFFKALGFITVPKSDLPHKVWKDCVRCHLAEACNEIAMIYRLHSS